MMKKYIPLTLALLGGALATAHSSTTLDFTTGEGFSTGIAGGNNGWVAYGFGNGGEDFTIDAVAGTLDFEHVNAGTTGAVRRDFTDIEAGRAFDAADTLLTWSFTIDDIDATGAFNTGLFFYIGDFGSGVNLQVRGDGRLQVNGGSLSGNDRIVSSDLVDGETFSIAINYAESTFSVTRSIGAITTLSGVTDPFTDVAFTNASSNPYRLRLQTADGNVDRGSNIGTEPFRLDSVSISATAVPEPSAYALLAGVLALGFVAVRRR